MKGQLAVCHECFKSVCFVGTCLHLQVRLCLHSVQAILIALCVVNGSLVVFQG